MTADEVHTFEVLLFGAAADVADADRVTVQLPAPTTVAELATALAAQHAALADAVRVGQLAVNHALADASLVVRGDEGAGAHIDGVGRMSALVEIVDGPVVSQPATDVAGIGARLRFEGIVRPIEGGAALSGLVYETYDPMAAQSLRKLAEEALERFEITRIHVVHSRGFVPVGMTSLLVEIGSRHRAAGLEAMGYFIDQLKQVVPIWKHLRYPDGRTQPAPGAAAPPPKADDSKS